jgi:hypothetical protein
MSRAMDDSRVIPAGFLWLTSVQSISGIFVASGFLNKRECLKEKSEIAFLLLN